MRRTMARSVGQMAGNAEIDLENFLLGDLNWFDEIRRDV
jgi:hypothetical protein